MPCVLRRVASVVIEEHCCYPVLSGLWLNKLHSAAVASDLHKNYSEYVICNYYITRIRIKNMSK